MTVGLNRVSDLTSNFPEQLQFYAERLAGPRRRKVLKEIYRGHKKPKYVSGIGARIKLNIVGVSQEASVLASIGLVTKGRNRNPETGKSESYYEKIPEIAVHLPRLLRLAENPKARKALVTKRQPKLQGMSDVQTVRVEFPKKLIQIQHLTIDEIDSFKKVINFPPKVSKLTGLSESDFRKGIQNVIGEKGVFKDWGGEKSDLMTTRLKFGGKRVRVAFAFKGPGQPGKLTIARMGKNGDQGPRLFEEAADIYFVQHWSEIDPQVHKFIETLATAKSATSSSRIYFCLVDGQDSDRLVRAYPKQFGKK